MTIEPFKGEAWTAQVRLTRVDIFPHTASFAMLVVVEELTDADLTVEDMEAREAAVHRAVLDQLRPFLNNATHVAIELDHGVSLDDVPVVKRATT